MAAEPLVTLGTRAMATRFEIVLHGDDPRRLRAAGEEALAEIHATERRLSRFLSDSDVGRINAAAAGGLPARVDGRTFRLLESCLAWSRITDGAFDVTVGPLSDVWREALRAHALPSQGAIAAAQSRVGYEGITLDPHEVSVALRAGMQIDLGAVGKGHAIDLALGALRDLGIGAALIHGGTSSVAVLGAAPGRVPWRVACGDEHARGEDKSVVVDLASGEALSVSSQHGQWAEIAGTRYGHVVDPRTGHPIQGDERIAVAGPCAALCDALATALLVTPPGERARALGLIPGYRLVCRPPDQEAPDRACAAKAVARK